MKVDRISSSYCVNTNPKFGKTAHGSSASIPQISSLSNISYKPLSFGRTWAEHKSWGAVIDPVTKETSFKIFTFPDTKKVTVTVEKQGETPSSETYALENKGGGIFETSKSLEAGAASHGDKYYYTLYKGNGDIENVKDPYTNRQEDFGGCSTLYDHSLYEWSDKDWFENNPNRISRLASTKNNLMPLSSAKIYELNVPTVTKDGTFEGVKEVIDEVKAMGFNTIHIMPAENVDNPNWGYDGKDKMAPSEYMGGPDGLKDLVNYAHGKDINVIMDVVPNHVAPDGWELGKIGPYLKGPNAFGDAFNYEGENSTYVRDFIVNAAINWIDNYHCDGLRLDMTKFMESDITMKQIAKELNYHKPDAFLIAEDGRSDKRVTTPLKPEETGIDEESHAEEINSIMQTGLDNLGFDSEWDFDFFHALKGTLYGSYDIEKLNNACNNSGTNVKYVMSHDEIGNYEGTRLLAKLIVPMLNLNDNITLDDEDISRAGKLAERKGMDVDSARQTVVFQKAQLTAEKLAIMLQTGELDEYDTSGLDEEDEEVINEKFDKEVLQKAGIRENSGITYRMLKAVYNKSYAKNKMALARTYSLPGPKMVFQGDESADLTPFRFFRKLITIKNEDYLYIEKGYQPGEPALEDSTLGNIDYSPEAAKQMSQYRNLTEDLNRLASENPALSKGSLIPENAVVHTTSQVLGTHCASDDDEIFSITNFQDSNYPRIAAGDYYIKFPKGKWVQILSTDDKKYGGTGKYNNKSVISSDGHNNSPIKLAAYSTVIFKKVE